VNLNFNKKGEQVKTKVGGVVSVLISIILLSNSGLKHIEHEQNQLLDNINVSEFL
jgi:hypothetical protein